MTKNTRTLLGLLLAATLVMTMALPAASDDHDRPEDVPPDPAPAAPGGSEAEDDEVSVDNTFNDFVSIQNPSGTGGSRLNLTSSEFAIDNNSWRMVNNADQNHRFELRQTSGTGDQNRLVVRQGGNVGVGIDNPLSPLHVERQGGFQLRLSTGGTADYRADAFGTSLRLGHVTRPNQIRIFGEDAPNEALVVGNGVAVGSLTPQADLDVNGIMGLPTTRIRIANAAASWINGLNAVGVFIFNQQGTGGAEFVVRERNHPTATLDVDGAVRATAFNTSSSSAYKTDVNAVDPLDVLARLNGLAVSTWRFRGCADGEGRLESEDGSEPDLCSGPGEGPRHMGPMAEDFQAAFAVGEDDGESIATVDANGIAFAAIQGLTQLLEEKDETISALQQQVSDLDARLQALEARGAGNRPSGAGPRKS